MEEKSSRQFVTELRRRVLPTTPQSYRSNFYNLFTSIVINLLQSTAKIALVPMWHIERYSNPYYHCNEIDRSQLYPRLVHQPACLYLFLLRICHLKRKFSYFITDRALKLKASDVITFSSFFFLIF